jgi:signal peptidase I
MGAMSEPRSVLREYLEALLIAGIFLGFTNTFLVKTFFIPSGSMEDTLLIATSMARPRALSRSP